MMATIRLVSATAEGAPGTLLARPLEAIAMWIGRW
jgi:hypothetical protein